MDVLERGALATHEPGTVSRRERAPSGLSAGAGTGALARHWRVVGLRMVERHRREERLEQWVVVERIRGFRDQINASPGEDERVIRAAAGADPGRQPVA